MPNRKAIDPHTADRWAGWALALFVVGSISVGCSGGATSPSATPSSATTSRSVGRWIGTTAQGATIAFVVSTAEVLTDLSVGYNFNGCSGTKTFSNLSVRTASTVICNPGPCDAMTLAYRSFEYFDVTSGSGPTTAVIGLFLSDGRAQGIVSFRDYPSCGTAASVEWSASR